MASFHTKSSERILSPVAQQVSKLILLLEDAGSGTEIPDLESRVGVVKVGYETISASDDAIFRQEMPPSLKRVEDASFNLEEAVILLRQSSKSSETRKKLIEGSRGILQGTSSVLLTFDMSEVRRIVSNCQAVLHAIATAESNLTPCMTQMIKEVDNRQEELTIQSHAALLRRGIEQVKRLTPILVSALKLHVNACQNELPGASECEANRNFLISQMSDEIQEIIRGLQLTGIDASEQFDDDQAAVHVTKATFDSRIRFADEWLKNPRSAVDSAGEKALHRVLASALRLAELVGSDDDRRTVEALCQEISRLLQALSDCKQRGEVNSPLVQDLRASCSRHLDQLARRCDELTSSSTDKHNNPIFRLSRTLEGKLVQAQRWLADPRGPQRQVGLEACHSLATGTQKLLQQQQELEQQHAPGVTTPLSSRPVSMDSVSATGSGSQVASESSTAALEACREASEHVKRAADRFYDITAQPEGPEINNAQHDLATAISRSLAYIWQTLQQELVQSVADSYTDLVGPLRALNEAACGDLPNQEEVFNEKAKLFMAQCCRLSSTAELAATTCLSDVWRADALRCLAGQLPELGGQVTLAGRAVLASHLHPARPHEQATGEHFALMHKHWLDSAERMRSLVDEAVDPNVFVVAQEEAMQRDTQRAEESIKQAVTTGVVQSTTCIARRADRVLQLATREAENSEDQPYVDRMNNAVKCLRSTLTPMVLEAKGLVTDIRNPMAQERWRNSNHQLLSAVSVVKHAVAPSSLPTAFYHQTHPQGGVRLSGSSSLGDDQVDSELSTSVRQMNQLSIQVNGHRPEPLPRQAPPYGGGSSYYRSTSGSGVARQVAVNLVHHRHRLHYDLANSGTGAAQLDGPASPAGGESSDTEVEEEFNFPPPDETQPIMAAAHALHHEVRHWSSRDNELIAISKRVAALMAKLSQVVRGEGGTKKDLINTAMSIAGSSLDVNRCVKELAKECTDRRIRTNLNQLSDRILTIGNQLRILSTVKATMLGAQDDTWYETPMQSELDSDTNEEAENSESLVLNAQNLMQTVIETLRVAKAASIKMRVDSGFKIVWRPRPSTHVHAAKA